jgi:two-component system LytT family response regulator
LRKISAIIADDEPLARERVRSVLKDEPDVQIVAECADGAQAFKETQKRQPDLLFLDVQMPRLNGFEVLELIGPDVPVVFVTAYDEFALKAFEVHAVDYLLKPVAPERLLHPWWRGSSDALTARIHGGCCVKQRVVRWV